MEKVFYIFIFALLIIYGLIFLFQGFNGIYKGRMKLIKRDNWREWLQIKGKSARLIGIIYIILGILTIGVVVFMLNQLFRI